MIPALMAVNLWAIINYQGENSSDEGNSKTKKEYNKNVRGDPVDMSTGENLVQEEGLRLATPGIPLSFDLHYNSGNDKPGILGRGWGITLNWQLSLIYTYYYQGHVPKYAEYGAMLSDSVFGSHYGPLSEANPNQPGTFITKQFLISDGTRIYLTKGGWTNNADGQVSDWNWHGGHYTEMPVDWELVHTNSEYRLLFPGKKWMTFSDDGRMAAMGDAWGNTITRSRNGDTETYAHSNGRWLKFIYATTNLISGTTDLIVEIQADDGRWMCFNYSNDCLACVAWYGSDNKKRIHDYSYERIAMVNRLVERCNAEGTVSQYGYDSQGKATSMNVNSNWYRHTVTYGSTPQMRYYGHGTSWAEDYQYDSSGRLAGMVGPWNASAPKGQQGETYTYDNWRNIVAERYFEGSNTLALTDRYDDHHRLLESAIGNGVNTQRLSTTTWSEADRLPSSINNADGLTLNLEYINGVAGLARLVGGGQTEEVSMSGWDDRGMPGVVRDARGAETHQEFNTDGNVTTIQPPTGPGYGFEYDTVGRLQKVNRLEPGDVARTLAEYERDGFGQITKAIYPDGLFEQFAYDPMCRLTNAMDRAGRETHLAYWPIGKIKSVKREMGGGEFPGISFDYDEQGTDLKVTDELGRVVEGYALDVAGRPTAVTNILGQTLQVTYAILDLPQQIRRFDNSTVSFTYNAAWRPATIQYPDDTVNLTFSGGGLLQKIADQTSGTILNKYDALSRWAGQTGPRTWDEVTVINGTGGLPTSVTSVGGTVSYSYDIGSRLSSISGPAGIFNYSYNPTNGLIAGVSCSAAGLNADYTFDVLDRVVDIAWKDASTNVVRGFAYSYNSIGMITNVVREDGGRTEYTYDNLDRLISETSVGSVTSVVQYSYDLVGNRTQSVVNSETVNYVYAPGNRLVSWSTNSQQNFDSAGNVTNIQYDDGRQLALTWDSRYRVTEVRTNGNIAEKYQYDALDRRISISDGATTNYLVYAGPHVIAEVGMSGSLIRSYTYGTGIDNILSMTVYGGVTQTYYYVKDHLGTVAAVVDGGGQVVESYQYDAWGNVLEVKDGAGVCHPSSVVGNSILWQGREYSWKIGLYYFRARWYDPVTGRWLSNDPIGISGGLNQYVFCGDNPVNFRDPFGLLTWEWFPSEGEPWVLGRAGSPIPEGSLQGRIIESLPGFHNFAQIHDAMVTLLTAAGVPDIVANVPTMTSALYVSLFGNAIHTIATVFDGSSGSNDGGGNSGGVSGGGAGGFGSGGSHGGSAGGFSSGGGGGGWWGSGGARGGGGHRVRGHRTKPPC